MTESQSRDDKGRFSSTALTKKRDMAITEAGGADTLYGLVESGKTHREIANALGLDGGDYTTQRAIREYLRRDPDRYEDARRESAEALAERAGEVYGDEAPVTSADAKWRHDLSGYWRWLAETRDPSIRQAGVNVNVDVGSLHLDALRTSGRMTLNPDLVGRDVTTTEKLRESFEAEEAEYEVEDE